MGNEVLLGPLHLADDLLEPPAQIQLSPVQNRQKLLDADDLENVPFASPEVGAVQIVGVAGEDRQRQFPAEGHIERQHVELLERLLFGPLQLEVFGALIGRFVEGSRPPLLCFVDTELEPGLLDAVIVGDQSHDRDDRLAGDGRANAAQLRFYDRRIVDDAVDRQPGRVAAGDVVGVFQIDPQQ